MHASTLVCNTQQLNRIKGTYGERSDRNGSSRRLRRRRCWRRILDEHRYNSGFVHPVSDHHSYGIYLTLVDGKPSFPLTKFTEAIR